jgi:hypothetical protein
VGACSGTWRTLNPARMGMKVELGDLLSAEKDVVDAIASGRPQRHVLALKRLRHEQATAVKADAAGVHAADAIVGRIGEWLDRLAKAARAWRIARNRRRQTQRFVRPFEIVDNAPARERAPRASEIGEGRPAQHLGFERAMEAFVLAHGLGMVGARVRHIDVLLHEKDTESGEARLHVGAAPGRAVVGDHRTRQAVASKRLDQCAFHRFGALIGAGFEHDGEAGVIVEHGERVQAVLRQRHVPFETICHRSLGLSRSKRMNGFAPPPC